MKTTFNFLGVSSLALLMSMTVPTVAHAQDADTAQDEVFVTGTRIQRKDLVSQSPLVTTDIERIEASGTPTLDDFIKDLPQFAPGQGDFSNDSNGGTAGRATLNLRNLGSQRNLVLMDGRRLMSSGTDGAIDINTIPSQAIGGIETITGGASATYGSDALSGVVNFKTRDLDGFEMTGRILSVDDVGEDSYKVGAAYGTEYAGGKGNLLITGEYTDRGGVRVRDREEFFNAPQVSSFLPNSITRNGRNVISFNDAASGNFADIGPAFNSSNGGAFGADGAAYSGSTEPPIFVLGNGSIRYYGQIDNFLQVPLDQKTAFMKTDYEFDNGVTGYGHALFASSTAFNEGAPPISAGSEWGLFIPENNYYLNQLPTDLRDTLIGTGIATAQGQYQTRFTQAGGRVYNTENDVFQILGGVKGSLSDRDINWDIHVSYGTTDTTDETISGAISYAAVQDIINGTDPDTGVSSECAGGFNPFGGTDPLSPECLAFASRTPINETKLTQTVVEGVVEGKLTDMPAGEARFALTGHIRENTFEFNPDADVAAGNLANLASTPEVVGDIQVYEAGAEVFLPLLAADSDFLQSFNLILGGRLSSYEPGGSATTYKAEFDSRVNENLMFRGGYQRAVRVPNVDEFFRPRLLRVNGLSNWCASNRTPDGRTAEELAQQDVLCTQLGQQVSFRQGASSGPTFTQGNRNLTPETADTLTLGAVVNFDVDVADVSLTVDYYDIEIKDPILRRSAAEVYTKCLNADGVSNPTYDPNYIFCQGINFTPAGNDVEPVNIPTLNGGAIKTSGIDIAGNVGIPVDALGWGGKEGRINLNAVATLLDNYEVQILQGESFFTDFTGTVDASQATPDLKLFNTLTIDSGPVRLTGTWRHISGMEFSVFSTEGSTDPDITGTDAFNYFDVSGRVEVMDNYEIFAGVNNLTDKDPVDVDSGGDAPGGFFSTNGGVYDTIGRTFFVGAKAKF